MRCECYRVGGPFIAEDPDCPIHGYEAQAREKEERAYRESEEEKQNELLARIIALEEKIDAMPQCTQPARSVPKDGLPDRDPDLPAEQQGLFRKFVVHRTDGSSTPGGKHCGCRYFVLDVDHDKHAVAALTAYAADCEKTHPELAKDLREKWGAQPAPSIPEAVMEVIADLIYEVERNICPHEETHRGGQWEICDMCGARWADDMGGKPEFKWPEVVEKARDMLAAAPEAKP